MFYQKKDFVRNHLNIWITEKTGDQKSGYWYQKILKVVKLK